MNVDELCAAIAALAACSGAPAPKPGPPPSPPLFELASAPELVTPASSAEVNSAGAEWAPAPLRDGSLLFATDGRGGRGRHDLFVARAAGAGFAPATPLPLTSNVADGHTLGPAIDWADPSILYFTSHRPEAKAGKLDLYRVRYRVRR